MKVFCLYGWDDFMRESKYETVTQWDFRKIGRFLKGQWPSPEQPFELLDQDRSDWVATAVQQDFVVVDVENYFYADRKKNDMPDFPDGRVFKDVLAEWEKETKQEVKYEYDLSEELQQHIAEWRDYCYAIGFEARRLPTLLWSELADTYVDRGVIGEFLRSFIGRVPVVAHNSTHDVRILKRNFGITFDEYLRVDDSMLLHNVLWPELPHRLNFCSGVYSTINMHKDLGTHSLRYLQGDVQSTAEVWVNLRAEADRDPRSWNVYETLQRPMLPHLLESHEAGIRINKPFLYELENRLGEKCAYAQEVADDYVASFTREGRMKRGKDEWAVEPIEADPSRTINMNSPKQMNQWIFENCGLRIKGLRRSKKSGWYPLGKDQIAILQDQFYPRDDHDTFELRLEHGGHPLVEAKAEYTQANKFLSSYVLPYLESDRFHPDFKLHGQATGRWSTTGPNIPGMHKSLKPLMIPDVGMCWIGGDASNAELRIMAHLSDDAALKKGFAEGWDLHSMHTAQAFGWDSPKGRYEWAKMLRKIEGLWDDWKDREFLRDCGWWGRLGPKDWKKVRVPVDFPWEQWVLEGGPQPGWLADDDPFRRFCKILVFRLMYGGATESAAQIPGARSMGLPEKRLVQASKDLILAHPCWQEYWDDYGKQARFDKLVRNPNGRARRLMSTNPNNRFREGVNFPIQSWVSDWLNKTLLLIKEEAPWAVMKCTCHDSFFNQAAMERSEELAEITMRCAEDPLAGDFFIPFEMERITYDEREEKRIEEKWTGSGWEGKKAE